MKKKIIYLSFILVLVISLITLSSIYKSKDNKYNKHNTISKDMAIMIKEEGATDYVRSNSKDIPKGNYVLNEEKTHCENNGKVISYDNITGKIGFSFIGSDRCYLFFEVVTDTEKPVISNLTINGKTISATLTDNEGLLAYGFSTSNLTEPTSWTTISGKTYNLNTTINTEGTYYLWVKDGVGNKAVSDVIDLENRGWKTILANNTVNETTPDFSKVAKTNEGLFKADDDYTATTGMKSYYFRGAVDNNWVKFGKDRTGKYIYWRIIRINGDGSIKLVLDNIVDEISKYYSEDYSFLKSTIFEKLNNWYTNNLNDYSDYIAYYKFCNDTVLEDDNYLAYNRVITNKIPTFVCLGNLVNSRIGLLTIDEVSLAGGSTGENKSYYLYNEKITNSYYTMSSASSRYGNYYPFVVDTDGSISSNVNGNLLRGVRPVINIIKTAKVSGNGTNEEPYEIIMN